MQTRRFFMTEPFGQQLILRPDHLFPVLIEPFGHRSKEESHEDGRFTFDGARRWAFGCHVDITGHGSCEGRGDRARCGDNQMSFGNKKALPRKLQGLGQHPAFLVPELHA
jgi:hypothetical protein